jgi:hypothetical protein
MFRQLNRKELMILCGFVLLAAVAGAFYSTMIPSTYGYTIVVDVGGPIQSIDHNRPPVYDFERVKALVEGKYRVAPDPKWSEEGLSFKVFEQMYNNGTFAKLSVYGPSIENAKKFAEDIANTVHMERDRFDLPLKVDGAARMKYIDEDAASGQAILDALDQQLKSKMSATDKSISLLYLNRASLARSQLELRAMRQLVEAEMKDIEDHGFKVTSSFPMSTRPLFPRRSSIVFSFAIAGFMIAILFLLSRRNRA